MTLSVDDVREFWDRRPCNIRHSPLPVGTAEYWEQVDERRYFVEPHIPAFAAFEAWRGKRVLEVGCGIGTDTARFATADAHVTALDLSPKSAELTRGRLETLGLPGEVLVHDVEQPLPHMDVPPDLIYSFGAIHHTPRPGVALANLRAVAGPNTELRIMLYHRWSTKALAILASTPPWRWAGAIAERSEAQQGSPVTYSYSRRTASRLLRGAGWEPTSITVRHIFPYRVADYVRYRYVRRFPWNVLPARQIGQVLGWHLLITARPM